MTFPTAMNPVSGALRRTHFLNHIQSNPSILHRLNAACCLSESRYKLQPPPAFLSPPLGTKSNTTADGKVLSRGKVFCLKPHISQSPSIWSGGSVCSSGSYYFTHQKLRSELHLTSHLFGCIKQMASLATAESCDANMGLIAKGELRALQPIFQMYGQCRVFSGPVVTLKVFEDNVMVREILETPGDGRVLVIDGGGSMRCALVGGNLGQLAQNMGWAGILLNGCIRDVDEINGCDIGIRALGSHPLKSSKKGIGEKHVAVSIGGTQIQNGEWLYADSDGILISKTELLV